MRILQFNIQYGQPYPDEVQGGAGNLRKIVGEIERLDPDIVFLQEVEHALPGGDQIHPAPNYELLKSLLPNYHSWFHYPPADPQELPFGIGLAFFSKYPLLSPYTTVLPAPSFSFEFEGSRRQPTARLLIGADIEHEGKTIRLLNTHLQAFFIVKQEAKNFPQQREVVGGEVVASPHPVILAGDFNSAPGEDTVEYFESLGLQTAQKEVVTWHRMPYVLDHIFYPSSFACERCEVISSYLSDHLPLLADLSWVK